MQFHRYPTAADADCDLEPQALPAFQAIPLTHLLADQIMITAADADCDLGTQALPAFQAIPLTHLSSLEHKRIPHKLQRSKDG